MANKKSKESLLCCPKCGSTEVVTTEETCFMVNSGEHYCHSVKAHDSDAKALCVSCSWTGVRHQLQVC